MADDELPYGVSHGRGVAHMRGVANRVDPSASDSDDEPESQDVEASEGDAEEANIQATVSERRKARGWIEFDSSGG